jgi:hypothetical protein
VLADDDILRRRHVIRFQVDPQVVARVILARILWLQGFPDQAMRTAESSVDDARAANHALSVCYALATGACVIALLVGDLAAAEHYVGMLLDHSTRHSLTYWRAYGRCHQGALAITRGDVNAGLRLLRAGFDDRGASRLARQVNTLLMIEALGRAGQIADGLVAIEEAIARAEHTDERWLMAELLRGRGSLPASARLGAPAGSPLLGTASRHESRAALARPTSRYEGARAAGAGLRPLHRMFRDGRPASGQQLAGATSLVSQTGIVSRRHHLPSSAGDLGESGA